MLPFEFNRTTPFAVVPFTNANKPPKTIFPSGCNTAESTEVFAPEVIKKDSSMLPSLFNLT